MTLELEGLGSWLPGSGTTFENVSLVAQPGSATLLAGVNGAGASTMLGMLMGQLMAGQRVVGRMRLDGAELAGADPDAIAHHISFLDRRPLPGSLSVRDVLGSSNAERSALAEIQGTLGVEEHLDAGVNEASASVILRARLTALLASRPQLLLLDQLMGGLESAWKPPVLDALAHYLAQGGTIMCAEQDLSSALLYCDQVYELGGEPTLVDAGRWRSSQLAWSPVQRVASALQAEADGPHRLEVLRARVLQRLQAVEQEPVRPKRPGTLVPVSLGEHGALQVDDGSALVVLCATETEAHDCAGTLRRANSTVTKAAMRDEAAKATMTIRDLAKDVDLVWGKPVGSTLNAIKRTVPTVRPDAWLQSHSTGQRALIGNEISLAQPGIKIVVEPFRFVDSTRQAELFERILQLWVSGEPVVVVTTDVEVAALFPRVLVWDHRGPVADGSPNSLRHALPVQPLVSQVCSPYAFASAEPLVQALGAAS